MKSQSMDGCSPALLLRWIYILDEELSPSPWIDEWIDGCTFFKNSWAKPPTLRGWCMYIGHETDRFLVDGCTFFMKTIAEPLSMDGWMIYIIHPWTAVSETVMGGCGSGVRGGAVMRVCVCVCVFVAGHHRRRHPHHDPLPSELFALKRDLRAFDCIFPRCAHSAHLLHASFTSFHSSFGPQ